MAGRGRGRGKPAVSFDVGHLGFGRGEALPGSEMQPPPLYPMLERRPTPLSATEVDEYLLALSQEFRGSIRDSPFYLRAISAKKDIERFTDRYKQAQKMDEKKEWTPDWKFFPKELKPNKSKKTQRPGRVNVLAAKRPKIAGDSTNVIEKLQSLEEKDAAVPAEADDEEGAKKKEGAEGEDDDEEEAEDDSSVEDEDINDYNTNYYDDGGDMYGNDDDGDEGPVY